VVSVDAVSQPKTRTQRIEQEGVDAYIAYINGEPTSRVTMVE